MFVRKKRIIWVWWHTFLNPALERQSHEDHCKFEASPCNEFEAKLDYIVSP